MLRETQQPEINTTRINMKHTQHCSKRQSNQTTTLSLSLKTIMKHPEQLPKRQSNQTTILSLWGLMWNTPKSYQKDKAAKQLYSLYEGYY